MEKKKLLILTLALVVLLAVAGVLYNALAEGVEDDRLATLPTKEETTVPGGEAPGTDATEAPTHDQPQDFSAPDFIVVDGAGKEYALSDFVGKPVVLNFWASWCGPCKSEMPDFQTAYEQYGGEIHFLMVNLTDGYQETVESASGFIARQGYTFPVYYDTNYSAAMAYGVNAVPVTYFIDAQGQLIAYGQGAMDAETLQRGIGMILPEPE